MLNLGPMAIRLIRIVLVVVAVAIALTASYLLQQNDNATVARRAAADALRDSARTLAATIAEMRTAQVAYVARGQGEAFWMGRVTKLLPVVQQQMTEFAASLSSPAAQQAFEPASAAMDNFQKLDARAQDFVKAGNVLMAADLIFSDGIEATTTARNQIDAALGEELQTRQAQMTADRREQLAILGGSAGGVMILMLVLAFVSRSSAPVEQQVAPIVPERSIVPQPQAVVEAKPANRNLANAARICTDLARVAETKELPFLLERTANVLDASGLILWVADPTATALRPALSFGYTDQVISRMGSIHRDSNNAAASAYRSCEMRSVNGALVMPLLVADGCIGVLSAEMKGGSEKDESSQAIAAIFAAQLATLVSPPPATVEVKTAAQA